MRDPVAHGGPSSPAHLPTRRTRGGACELATVLDYATAFGPCGAHRGSSSSGTREALTFGGGLGPRLLLHLRGRRSPAGLSGPRARRGVAGAVPVDHPAPHASAVLPRLRAVRDATGGTGLLAPHAAAALPRLREVRDATGGTAAARMGTARDFGRARGVAPAQRQARPLASLRGTRCTEEPAPRPRPSTFLPARPMPKRLLAVPSGLNIGRRRIPNWDIWFGINLAAAMAVASSGVFRKGELALQDGASHAQTQMSRASLTVLDHPRCHRASAGSIPALHPPAGRQSGVTSRAVQKWSLGHLFRRPPALLRIRPGSVRPFSAARYRQSASALHRCSHQHAGSNQCGIGTSTTASARCSWSFSVRRLGRREVLMASFRVPGLRAAGDRRPRGYDSGPLPLAVSVSLRVYARVFFEDYTSATQNAAHKADPGAPRAVRAIPRGESSL